MCGSVAEKKKRERWRGMGFERENDFNDSQQMDNPLAGSLPARWLLCCSLNTLSPQLWSPQSRRLKTPTGKNRKKKNGIGLKWTQLADLPHMSPRWRHYYLWTGPGDVFQSEVVAEATFFVEPLQGQLDCVLDHWLVEVVRSGTVWTHTHHIDGRN